MSLWSEVKQRRITQIVVTYLVTGWIVVSVVDQPVDRGVLPEFVYQVVLTLYLFGILGALIIGWYHGEKGEQKAPLREIVMLAVLTVLALGTSGIVVSRSLQESTLADALDTDDLRNIGVVYFEDMSRDGSMRPVADGITEGLISALSGVQELNVRSRNAAREAGALGDVATDSIASFLEVGALIDGTVDEQGDEISVSVRLLEGQTGAPIFRDTFRWPRDQLTSIGSDLAEQISNVLREQIGGEIRLREARDQAPNAAAWLQVARAERQLKSAEDALLRRDVDALVDALDMAEEELVAAQESAPEWAEPLVLLSRVAYEWYVLLQGNRDELVATLDRAVEHADAALALDPDNAAALEWRGTALYRRWLTRVDEGSEADRILARARADLERAARLDPSRASVQSTLSHLYYQIDDWVGAVLAARTAYEQDAFLDVADGVLWRLYTASYDLGEYGNARDWCEEGHERFPGNFRFVQCQIYLMTMPDAEPDVEQAWELLAELEPLLTERPEYYRSQALVSIGGIIGRAGMPDSAQAVFQRARVGPEIDPDRENLALEAAMRSVIGDVDGAISTLERFMVATDDHAPGRHWWWQRLEGEPGFERLQALH